MAVGESAGSVYVTIDGDASPLMAKLVQAESASRAAGQRIGTALVSPLVDASGRAMAAVTTISGSLIGNLAPAADKAAGATNRTAAGIRAVGTASEHSVSQIQASGGALRTAFGEQSIRAAERFITLIPGVGTALQSIFPLIGAFAFVEMLDRVFQKSEKVTAAENEMASATKRADDAFVQAAQSIDKYNAKDIGRQFGAAAGARAEITVLELQKDDLYKDLQKAKDTLGSLATEAQGKVIARPTGGAEVEKEYKPKFAAAGKEIEAAQSRILAKEAEIRDARKEAPKLQAEESGAAGAQGASSRLSLLTKESELAKQTSDARINAAHATRSAEIESIQSEYGRVEATGKEEIAFAQEKQKATTEAIEKELPKRLALIRQETNEQAQGKSQPEQKLIYAKGATEEQSARLDAQKQLAAAEIETGAAGQKAGTALIQTTRQLAIELKEGVVKGWDEVAKTAERSAEEQQKALQKTMALMVKEGEEASRAAEGRAHIAEEVGKGQGEIATARVKAQYEDQISHSIQQEVTYQEQLASIQDATYTKELTALAAKLKAAQALGDETEKAKQLLDVEAQIAALSGNAQAATISAQGAIGKTQTQGFGQQLGQAGTAGLSSLSTALGKGITDGGRGLGKDIRQSLQGIGKQMLGDAIKTSVEDLVIAMTGNTIATNLNTLWTEIQALASTLFGFADGTDSAPGGFAMVGERGPEIMHVPRGAQIIPNHKISKYADGTPGFGRATSRSSSMAIGELHVHAHGVSNPDAFARQAVAAIPHELKRQSSTFSPYSS